MSNSSDLRQQAGYLLGKAAQRTVSAQEAAQTQSPIQSPTQQAIAEACRAQAMTLNLVADLVDLGIELDPDKYLKL